MYDLLVLGLDADHERVLRRLRGAEDCVFHPLFAQDQVRGVEEFSVDAWMAEARGLVDALGVDPDGIINYWDFPVTEIAAMLAAEYGLPMASLEALVRVQHKYLARLLQRELAPDVIPPFQAIDVFDDDSLAGISLPFPFWIKPVRSFRSHLGFRVRSPRGLARAVAELREGLPRLAGPYDDILRHVDLPDTAAPIGGRWCIAEGMISGRQCTLEGWSHAGEAVVYGAVDSVQARNRTSFARYQYPSSLPRGVVARMAAVATEFVQRTGLTESGFNAEFYWDRRRDRIWLLEVNARASQSHFELFEMVDGLASAQVVLDLALGRRPGVASREGDWPMAAKYFLRTYDDAVVTRVPCAREVAAIERELTGVEVHLGIATGTRLSELPDQDSYSYELGYLIIGGTDERDILAKARECHDRLRIQLCEVSTT